MSKQSSSNNVLPMEINIVFEINTNSPSANRRESTNLNTFSDFTKRIIFIFRNSCLASYLAIQVTKNKIADTSKKLYGSFLWMEIKYQGHRATTRR